ncbi:MAG: cbb3-type cytochrome c oxidase subunit II [Opitutales bacterium]
MKNMGLIFLGVFFAIAASWTGLIYTSNKQFGYLQPIAIEEGETPQPMRPVGTAEQGKQVYQDLGCLYCHSQQVRRKGFGADYERGWGDRQSVPRDYIMQKRVLLGTSRTGPDLMTVGTRLSDPTWHYLHLYDPIITSPDSIMPKFKYLFKKQKIGDAPSPRALKFPPSYAHKPEEGYEIVPTERADALVAYLLSLKMDYELPESKFAND